VQFPELPELAFDELFRVFVADDRVLLPVEDDDGQVEGVDVLLDPVERVEEGLGHLGREEGDHQPVLEDVVHVLVVLGQRSGVYHGIDNQVFEVVPQLLHEQQLALREVPVGRQPQERTRDKAPADLDFRPLNQQLYRDEGSHAVGVHEKRKVWPGLRQQSYDVIFHHLHSRTPPRPSRVAKPGQVDEQHFVIVRCEEASDFIEAARVFSEAVEDGDCFAGVGRSELRMVKPDVCEGPSPNTFWLPRTFLL
jgi:hypothetical protein